MWGTDYAGFGIQIKGAVEGLRNFQIPEDMQEGYGYPPITDEDKAKMFGGNLGRLLGHRYNQAENQDYLGSLHMVVKGLFVQGADFKSVRFHPKCSD